MIVVKAAVAAWEIGLSHQTFEATRLVFKPNTFICSRLFLSRPSVHTSQGGSRHICPALCLVQRSATNKWYFFNVLSKKIATKSKNSHRKCEQVSVSCKSLLLSKLITWQHQGYRCYPFTPCFLWGEFLDQLDDECEAPCSYPSPFPSPCSCPSPFPNPCRRSCQVLCPKSGSVQLILKSANSRKAIHEPLKMKRK